MTNTDVINEMEFSFCPICGGKLERYPPKLLVCPACKVDHYINARPCNAVVLADVNGRILLTKRKFEPSAGLWDLPGGFIDIGETAEESIIREMQEELGIKVKNIKYLCSGQDRYIFKRINYYTLGFVFTAEIESGEMIAKDDVEGFRFFAKNEIPWNSLAFPILKKTLEIYFKRD